jgi:hypothetical protein
MELLIKLLAISLSQQAGKWLVILRRLVPVFPTGHTPASATRMIHLGNRMVDRQKLRLKLYLDDYLDLINYLQVL